MATEYDYIIVGAGAAGCVLANRLSENPKNKVLLLEYGGSDVSPMHAIPKGFFFTLSGDKYAYHYPTGPVGPGGQIESWTRGKVTGGSTTINGMMYTRGFAADYDSIVDRGNPGWGWDEILPIYKRIEDHQLGATATRGAGGPYGVSAGGTRDTVTEAILASAEKVGWKVLPDINEEEVERIGFTPSSIKDGKRVSAASAFLRPALKRSNLTYLTRTKVGYLIFDGTRVVGVRGRRKGRTIEFRARREVIASAGTVESTLLLERSGVGKADVLHDAGVPLVVESPNLGERVIEQRGVAIQVKLKEQIGATQKLNSIPKQGWEGFKYLFTKSGPIATGGYDLVAGFKSSPELDRPDMQGIFVPMALDTASTSMKLAKHSGIMFMAYQIRPTSHGSVHLGGKLPDAAPIINPGYLQNDTDRKATASILDRVRTIFAEAPVSDLISEEEYPGPGVSTEDEVIRYSQDAGGGIFHAVGAAAMGPNDDDVVDSQLRVRGLSGLRVIDASVFAQQPSGNSAAPTMVLAWRAADMILAGE